MVDGKEGGRGNCGRGEFYDKLKKELGEKMLGREE